jgi:Histidine kinase-, DNA gyrase B-, and HSP90-like ATPase
MGTPMSNITERLLTELERADLYLSDLPENYDFPLFSGKQAVESQRRSAYKSTARAARELVDNAYEAGAKNIWITFQRPAEREKGMREDKVAAIAFIDDGPGMVPKMLRYALTWGGGTHFQNPEGIGKFGFGLPNSSINQTRRVEVYSKTADGSWNRAELDINEVPAHGLVTINPPVEATLPDFVQEYLASKKITLSSGTVVVWIKPDRLTYRVASTLREHLIDDFGVVYRGLLDNVNIIVESTKVRRVDPLFLTPDALLYKRPEDGGAMASLERTIAVRFSTDEITGAQQLEGLTSEIDLEKARQAGDAIGALAIKVARFPIGFVLGDKKFRGTDEYKRFEIRKPRRGMSFVRAGREIDTVDAFPKSSKDEASGLGEWPLLQGYAYHWGIEVTFGPELDEAFGIGNDKQTVRPIEDFWRMLAKAEIDKALQVEQSEQRKARKKDKKKTAEEKRNDPTATTPATEAAAQAGKVVGARDLADAGKEEAKEDFERTVRERTANTGASIDAARAAIMEEAKRRPYAIGFFESEGGVFYKPSHGNGLQRVALVNTAHPFFENFYADLLNADDPRASYAVDVLLLALADAELRAEDDAKEFYLHEREDRWSPFLKIGLTALERLHPRSPEEEEEQAVG